MRVISGDKRGRRLKEPKGMETRPTTDQVKEAMFSILQFELEGKEVLDLFAGTGQLGIEALSRGAKRAVFCEESPAALKIIGENLKICGLEDRARVCRGDALRLLPGLGSFDIILIDPPYASDYYEKCLKTIIEIDNLREHFGVEFENDEKKEQSQTVNGWLIKHFGDIPTVGETIDIDGFHVEIISVDQTKILKAKIARIIETT